MTQSEATISPNFNASDAASFPVGFLFARMLSDRAKKYNKKGTTDLQPEKIFFWYLGSGGSQEFNKL